MANATEATNYIEIPIDSFCGELKRPLLPMNGHRHFYDRFSPHPYRNHPLGGSGNSGGGNLWENRLLVQGVRASV